MYDIEEIIGRREISPKVFFVCGRRNEMWSPRTVFGVEKNGKFRRINIGKDLWVTPSEVTEREEIHKVVENDGAIHFSPDDLLEVAKEIGYIISVSEDSIRGVVSWFVYGRGQDYEYGMEWGSKIKGILNEDEKALFSKFEEKVGHHWEECVLPWKTVWHKEYDCEQFELKSALHVVMRSPRLLNSAIYFKEYGISEHSLHFIWNYLLCYDKKESFVEVLHFSDWGDENSADRLHDKYGIPKTISEVEDKSFIYRNDARLYVGEKYKMAVQITTSIDDWDGTAVVVPKDCKLSPMEIVSAGESVDYVEDNFFVKNQLVRV